METQYNRTDAYATEPLLDKYGELGLGQYLLDMDAWAKKYGQESDVPNWAANYMAEHNPCKAIDWDEYQRDARPQENWTERWEEEKERGEVKEHQCSFCWRYQGEQHMALCINRPIEQQYPSVPRAVAEWIRDCYSSLEEEAYNVVDDCYCMFEFDDSGMHYSSLEPAPGCNACRGTGLWPHRMTLLDMIVYYATA